jgi:hypothetical protein
LQFLIDRAVVGQCGVQLAESLLQLGVHISFPR